MEALLTALERGDQNLSWSHLQALLATENQDHQPERDEGEVLMQLTSARKHSHREMRDSSQQEQLFRETGRPDSQEQTPKEQQEAAEGVVQQKQVQGEDDVGGAGSRKSGVLVTLENRELWKQFNSVTNEMIVTKVGRRMFPLLQVSLSGMDSSASYALLLEFRLTNTHRWRFLNGEWQASGNSCSDSPTQRTVYIHPSSSLTGHQWMKEKVTFSKLKLSNKEDGRSKIKLNSLYRYQPCLYVVQLPSPQGGTSSLHSAQGGQGSGKGPTLVSRLDQGGVAEGSSLISSHIFTETQFVTVTAYQNEKITQMKIKHNPFAKAFLGSQDTLSFSRGSKEEDISSTYRTDYFHHQPTSTPGPGPTFTPQATPTPTPNPHVHKTLLHHVHPSPAPPVSWQPLSHYTLDTFQDNPLSPSYQQTDTSGYCSHQQEPHNIASSTAMSCDPVSPHMTGQWAIPQRHLQNGELDHYHACNGDNYGGAHSTLFSYHF